VTTDLNAGTSGCRRLLFRVLRIERNNDRDANTIEEMLLLRERVCARTLSAADLDEGCLSLVDPFEVDLVA